MVARLDVPLTPPAMRAMCTSGRGGPLQALELPMPEPGPGEVRVRVLACGVCRTDLHVIDGELPPRHAHIIPGHEIVGRVDALGLGATRFQIGERIGIPWLGQTCGHCSFCDSHRENLCDTPQFTGYDRNGGFAEYAVADERFCFSLPGRYDDLRAAPLLCAGLIGFRSYRMAGLSAGQTLGLYGFGAAAHIICQVAVAQGLQVFAFVRPGDLQARQFALRLGARWAGGSDVEAPHALDAAILFAPQGELIPTALRATRKGGRVVCAGIHMSRIPAFDYSLLWGERTLRSVANLTRADGDAFFALLEQLPVTTHVQPFALADANRAIDALRRGAIDGAAVLQP